MMQNKKAVSQVFPLTHTAQFRTKGTILEEIITFGSEKKVCWTPFGASGPILTFTAHLRAKLWLFWAFEQK